MIGFLRIRINGLQHYAFYYVSLNPYVIWGRIRLNCGDMSLQRVSWGSVGGKWRMGGRGGLGDDLRGLAHDSSRGGNRAINANKVKILRKRLFSSCLRTM